MADNEEGKETSIRGNEWEVVTLTASTYAATSDLEEVEVNDDSKENIVGVEEAETPQAETSQPMFMSGHFIFPPNQHENLPLESKNTEVSKEQGGEDSVPQVVAEEGGRSTTNDEGSLNTKGLTEDFPGIPFFDEKGNMLSISGTEFEEQTALEELNLMEKEQSIYSNATLSSIQSIAAMGESAMNEEKMVMTEPIEPSDSDLDPDMSSLPIPIGENKYDGPDLPCEAWWKRRAASLYAHAKEGNAIWSIFIAAAVMGLVILGQRWQQERWQVLQHKWQFGLNDERMARMLGPISRFKDAIVGGHRRGSFIRGNASTR